MPDPIFIQRKVGEIVKKHRKKMGLTQETVAPFLGISRSYYVRKETGQAPFSVVDLLNLAMLFNVTILEFVKFHPSSIIKEVSPPEKIMGLLEKNRKKPIVKKKAI